MTNTIPLSAIRPITVEAIREVTGCPDVLGASGKSLVEAMESVAQAASKVLGSQPDEARDAAPELAMMIRQLVSALRKARPCAPQDLDYRAINLLRKHGLLGSPLRDDAAMSKEQP